MKYSHPNYNKITLLLQVPPPTTGISPSLLQLQWQGGPPCECKRYQCLMEAVGASAPQAEQSRAEHSRVCLASLHFKVPAWCFFCTVYSRIIPLCRPSSRVNPHLSMLKTCQWSRILQSSKFFVCLCLSSEIQWDMYHCGGGAAVLSKAIKQTTLCIKIMNTTGEGEHKKPGCIF